MQLLFIKSHTDHLPLPKNSSDSMNSSGTQGGVCSVLAEQEWTAAEKPLQRPALMLGLTPAAAGLTCVNEGVFLHIRFLVKPLPTVLARVGSGV